MSQRPGDCNARAVYVVPRGWFGGTAPIGPGLYVSAWQASILTAPGRVNCRGGEGQERRGLVSTCLPCALQGVQTAFCSPEGPAHHQYSLWPRDKGERGVCAWKVLALHLTCKGHQEGGERVTGWAACPRQPGPCSVSWRISALSMACSSPMTPKADSPGRGPPFLQVGHFRLAEESQINKQTQSRVPSRCPSELGCRQQGRLPDTVRVY